MWPGTEIFPALIEEAAEQAQVKVSWIADGWIARIAKDGIYRHIAATYFPLNDSAAAHLAEDKVATFLTLEEAGVPAVPHEMVSRHTVGEGPYVEAVIGRIGIPAVIKPTTGKGGSDVHRADSADAAKELLSRLLECHKAVAVSPFEEIEADYRVVMLDDSPLLIYKKLVDPAEWRRNIGLGARPVAEESPAVRAELAELSRRAMRAIGGRFMSVDIIQTPRYRRVLEINAGVMLNGFAAASPQCRAQAVAVYREALVTCFETP